MNCSPTNLAKKRYTLRLSLAMVAYIIFLFGAVYAFKLSHPTGVLAYTLAILPALPCIGIFIIAGKYLAEESDEFQRMLFTQSMLWATGLTLSFATLWGFLDNFIPLPHFQMYLFFPIYWAITGFASAILRMRYR